MMKTVFASIFFLASGIATADSPKITSITCQDLAENHRAPVFVDIAADRPSSQTGLSLMVGNWVTYSPDVRGKSATVLGEIEEISFEGDRISMKGSFETEIVVNRRTGEGFVSALVKHDPVTGKWVGTIHLENFPLNCEVK